MATLAQDAFTDTNGVLLNAHAPIIGGPWVDVRSHAMQIQSNKATQLTDQHAVTTIDVNDADVIISVDIAVPNAASYSAGFACRATNEDNLILVALQRDSSGTPYLLILDRITAIQTVRATTNFVISPTNTTVTLTLTLLGTSIQCVASTGESVSFSTSFNQTEDKHGLYMYTESGYGICTFDAFLLTDGAAPPSGGELINHLMLLGIGR